MKKVPLHTFSVVMALLVLFSTMSFTVEKHYCGESLVGHAVFSSVEKCKSDAHSCGRENMVHMNKDKDSCCSDQIESIHGQDELNFHSTSFDLVPQYFIVPISIILEDFVPGLSRQTLTYSRYQPPQVVYDIQLLCQVFII